MKTLAAALLALTVLCGSPRVGEAQSAECLIAAPGCQTTHYSVLCTNFYQCFCNPGDQVTGGGGRCSISPQSIPFVSEPRTPNPGTGEGWEFRCIPVGGNLPVDPQEMYAMCAHTAAPLIPLP